MSKLVLVCEDGRKLREFVRAYHEHEGLGVVTTPYGAEAICMVERAGVDLLGRTLVCP
jgi:DNA-binding response OmpR family regulator